jgi:hypothetical protein
MTNTIEYVATSTKRTDIANYASFWSRSRRVEMVRLSIACKRILSLIALCSIVWFVAATAQAQELLGHKGAAGWTKTATGWWSPDTDSAAAPHLLLSMAEVGHFRGSDLPRTSTAQSGRYPSTAGTDYSIVDLGNFALAPKTPTDFSSLAYGDLPPSDSLFSFVQTKYLMWESSLADSRPLTYVNGVSVYSLLQVSYEDSHLPISLYVPPLRGSDAR